MILAIFALIGVAAGLLAGLLGAGGGLIIVPAMFFVLTHNGVDATVVMHLAVGTSMATIVITGSASTLSHLRYGHVSMIDARYLLPSAAIGAVAGALLVAVVNTTVLTLCFALFATVAAIRLLLPSPAAIATTARTMRSYLPHLPAGVVIGAVSALVGIGGGTMSVPYLRATGLSMRHAVGTSAAVGVVLAAFAAATLLTVNGDATAPPLTTGYVYWPAFVAIVLTSIPAAMAGARLTAVVPQRVLAVVFAAVLVVTALRMLAVAL